MTELNEIDFITLTHQLKTNQINYYNIYNADINEKQHFAVQYYLQNPHDNLEIEQPLSISFCDIECYTNHGEFGNIKQGKHPINAITEINTINKTISSFYLLLPSNYKLLGIDDTGSNINEVVIKLQEYYKTHLVNGNYIDDSYNIQLYLFNDDLELIKAYFNLVHQLDPLILSGFNSDFFDYPYLFYRLKTLMNGKIQDVAQIMSKFGTIDVNVDYISIPEYSYYDVLFFFKPRDEGGLNYGKKQPMYNLDWLGDTFLGVKKFEYKDNNLSLDQFYEHDPIHFLLYNIADVCITKALHDEFGHVQTHNRIRRLTKTPYSYSIRGSSAIYDTFIIHEQTQQQKYIRSFISTEKSKSFTKADFVNIQPLIVKNKKIQPQDINPNNYRARISKYSGAYVKNPKPAIITNGLTIDLDASLPPWERICIKRDNEIIKTTIGDYKWQENDEVETWDDEYNIVWKKIITKLDHQWRGFLVNILTNNNHFVQTTTNHSVFGSCINDLSAVEIKDANQFEVGEYLLVKQNNKLVLDKIIALQYLSYTGIVYDLSVEKHERFITKNGVGVHNSSLYPSMMVQSNISFDTFKQYVLPPCTYNIIETIEKQIPASTVGPKLGDMIIKHCSNESYQSKAKTQMQYYYIIMYLYDKIVNSRIPLKNILNPNNNQEALLLRLYMLPMLDAIGTVHIDANKEYNQFAYDYLFMTKEQLKQKYSIVYIVENIFETNCKINKYTIDDAINVIKQYIITIAGTIFLKHETKSGLFYEIIQRLWKLRKNAKNMRDQYEVGSDKYKSYDKLQVIYKVATNSLYGVFGLSTFRFSSHHIAQSITSQGRLINKIAQIISEQSLTAKYGEYPYV